MKTLTLISIHALRGEGDARASLGRVSYLYFNPRPPWGGRHCLDTLAASGKIISIHALRGEGDYIDLQSDPLNQ